MDAANQDRAEGAPGTILAAERERQGLARADIAQRLHMSVSQVEALEAGDFARLPRGTFLRGFVRNYARALGMDPSAALASLAESGLRDAAPGIVVPSQNIRFDPLGDRLSSPTVKAAGAALAVLVLGFAALYWWFYIRPTAPAARRPATEFAAAPSAPGPASEPRRAEPARVAAAPVAPPPEPAPKAPEAKPQATPAEPAAAPAAKPEPARPAAAPAPSPPAAATPARAAPAPVAPEPAPTPPAMIDAAKVVASGGSVIRFQFKGNSWVEIRDGRGKILLSRINPPGSEAEVVGRPPFSVVVGNAPEVRMYYNNREFDLEPHTRVAVARFTVE